MGLMLLWRKRRRRWRGGGGDGEYVEFRDDWFLNRLLVLEWAAHALAEPGTSVNGTASIRRTVNFDSSSTTVLWNFDNEPSEI